MITTKTGAAITVEIVLPELDGELDGMAVRVPTIKVSIVDLTFIESRDSCIEEMNKLVKGASKNQTNG